MPKSVEKSTKPRKTSKPAKRKPGRPRLSMESMEQARRRKEIALADLREMEARRRRGELIETIAVRRQWADSFAAIRDRMLMLPDRVGAMLARRDEADVRAMLRAELEAALRAVVDDAGGSQG